MKNKVWLFKVFVIVLVIAGLVICGEKLMNAL